MTKITPVLVLALASFLSPLAGAEVALDANNVVIVLDGSGSMENYMEGTTTPRMDAAKKGLLEVLKHIPADTQIGLCVFSATMPDPWIYPLGPRDDKKLEQAIRSVSPAGGTPLGEYIQIGATRLLAQRQEQHGYGTFRLLVVTDGEATDQELVDRFAPEVIARGVTMDVIGVDMHETHTLAKSASSYRSANDPGSLKKAVAAVFAEVSAGRGDREEKAAFDEIASLPPEMAMEMIQALSRTGNHPIGQPAPTPAPEPVAGDPAVPPSSVQAPGPVPASYPPSTPPKPRGEGEGVVGLVGAVVFFFVLFTAVNGSRKRNR